jgi:hypothetical protein
MDVEGYEKEVLEGGLNTLANNNYPPILFEAWGDWKEKEGVEASKIRKELFDLCYSIFDIINNDGFKIDKNHKNELKDFIDDTLLWAHVHEKPTKIDYKQKIDEVNDACDKILNEYKDKNIFEENELTKNPKDELENMSLALKLLVNEHKTMLKDTDITSLNTYLEDIFKIIYNNDTKYDVPFVCPSAVAIHPTGYDAPAVTPPEIPYEFGVVPFIHENVTVHTVVPLNCN